MVLLTYKSLKELIRALEEYMISKTREESKKNYMAYLLLNPGNKPYKKFSDN